MTDSINYLDQLQTSSTSLRLAIPASISQAVVDKITLIKERSSFDIPASIIYASRLDKKKFVSSIHLARVRHSGWQLEVVKAIDSNNEEVLVTLINKVGCTRPKAAVCDHRNGNNSMRAKTIRK